MSIPKSIGMWESVEVRNVGDEDYVDFYDSKRYVIPAGGSVSVPFGAVCCWLGHPLASTDPFTGDNVRLQEWQRVRVRLGILDDVSPADSIEENKRVRGESFKTAADVVKIPQLEVWYPGGVRLYTPLEDLDGAYLQVEEEQERERVRERARRKLKEASEELERVGSPSRSSRRSAVSDIPEALVDRPV